ncbi:MAG: DUF4412 domain-containing protein [Nitrospira sp.]|nr:DUF4412 domain-containing protein [Nitrospira sp.]
MRVLAALFTVTIAAGFPPPPATASDFEGVLHMTTTHGDEQPAKMDWMIKGDKARIERARADGRTHVMILDSKAKTMLVLFPERQAYTEIKLGGEQSERISKAMEDYEVERTGKTDKVAGRSCEIWRVKEKGEDKEKHEICVAKGFGRTASFWMEPMKKQPTWVTRLINEGGFGLRSIRYDSTGTATTRTEVTGIEAKSMDAALFAAPAGYQKMDRGAMMGAMGGEDVQKRIEEMKKRRAGKDGASTGGAKPDLSEMMKQFGERMKKQQQEGGQ